MTPSHGATDLLSELRALVGGDGQGAESPAPSGYARDIWPPALKRANERGGGSPRFVARPTSTETVAAILRWASDRGLTVTAYGAGTNVVGAIDGKADVVISLERMAGVHAFDDTSQIVTVGAGTNGGALEDFLAALGFTLGHYPQSLKISTVGGWLNTRATGTYSALFGGIERLVCGVTAVLSSGEIVRVPPRVRGPGGLDFLGLLCGSEGTLAVVTEVALSVQRSLSEAVVCATFESLERGLDAQRELVQRGHRIGLLRIYNSAETLHIAPPEIELGGRCLLITTVNCPPSLVASEAEAVRTLIAEIGGRIVPEEAGHPWLERRFNAEGVIETANSTEGQVFDTIEFSVPWRSAAACASELEVALGSISKPLFLHGSHAYTSGIGLYAMLHITSSDDDRALQILREAWDTALRIVAKHGGAIGHHHGIGTVRSSAYLASDEGRMHLRVKRALDERNTLYSGLLSGVAGDVGTVTR